MTLQAHQPKIMTRMRHRLQSLAYSSSLYQIMISGPVPKMLHTCPSDPWPGYVDRARALIDGAFSYGGQSFSSFPPDWLNDTAAPAWIRAVHGFSWLRDLRALGGDSARRVARALISGWLDTFEYWTPVVWDAPLIGDRLTRLVGLHDFALSSADGEFRARVFESMVRQTRHLLRIVPEALAGLLKLEENENLPLGQTALQGCDLLRTVRGLVFAGVALPDSEKALGLALSILPTAMRAALGGDGAVRERNPSVQGQALQCLIDIRQALREARMALPPELPHAIEKASAALRFFRYGDGGLALFNGGQEDSSVMIDALLTLSDARGRAPKSCGGYERVHAGRMLLLVDAGSVPAPGLDEQAHAGIGAFELSAGRERLIVNCGHHPSDDPENSWSAALASTAAHTAVTLNEKNSSEVLNGGGFGRKASVLSTNRVTTGGTTTLVVVHDGYNASHGVMVSRTLTLDEEQERLAGVERLEGEGAGEYAFRFHLHPGVQASLTHSGTSVLVRAGSGFYRFSAEGLPVSLEESLYFGGPVARRSQQIVLRATMRAGLNTVTWQFAREKKA
jgi:uncharacterized heparinase superfamily protein